MRTEFNALVQSSIETADDVATVPWGEPAQDLSLTWNPSHDSVRLSIGDSINTAPLFVSNYNYKDTSNPTTGILAIAGNSLVGEGGRLAAFGGNPLVSLWDAVGNNIGGSGFDVAMVNVVRWLLGQNGTATSTSALTPRIVTAHLPGQSSFW